MYPVPGTRTKQGTFFVRMWMSRILLHTENLSSVPAIFAS